MQIVAVTKGVPLDRVRQAVAAGLLDLGENRVQEAAAKVEQVEGARWHMVGRLQSNKASRAVALFDEIHSIDSIDLAERLDRAAASLSGRRLPVYVQVNVDADAAKSGFAPAALEQAMGRLAALEQLELRGLMTIGRAVDRPADARSTFAALAELSGRLRSRHPRLGDGLSMGMSDDFEVAVEEGATVLRIGRALFGDR